MDFDSSNPDGGRWEALDPALLPPQFVAWRAAVGTDSSAIHRRARAVQRGRPGVRGDDSGDRPLATERRRPLTLGDSVGLGVMLDENFDLRRRVYDLDPRHVELVETARRLGARRTTPAPAAQSSASSATRTTSPSCARRSRRWAASCRSGAPAADADWARRQLDADLLRQHEADVLVDRAQLGDVLGAAGAEELDELGDELLGSAGAGGDADGLDALEPLLAHLEALSIRCEAAPSSRATSTSRFEFDELVEPITRTRSHSRASCLTGDLAVGGRVTDVVGLGLTIFGNRCAGRR